MSALHSQEGRLEEHFSLGVQHSNIRQCEEFLILIKLILDALIPADVDPPTYGMRGCLKGGVYGYLGNDFRKDLSLVIIFNGHVASHGLWGDPDGNADHNDKNSDKYPCLPLFAS
jgi:hypothetical protein